MTHFETELAKLKDMLLTMGSHAETSVLSAIRALIDRDDEQARAVKNNDIVLDQFEIDIDESALLLLAKAPLARDLRLITVAMKISQNLERVGDEATTVARRAIELNTEPQLKPYVDIPRMANIAIDMLREALGAFVSGDADKARKVIPRDKEVDEVNRQLQRELTSFMIEKPTTISRCLHLMTISKSLERIADHAKNVAEEVVFLLEAKDIRHENPAA
jgi:phosphate transport system protein